MAEKFAELKGISELDKKLAKLGPQVGFKALRGGLMGASRPMFQAAKRSAEATGIKGYDAGATAAAMGRWTKKTGPKQTTLFLGPKNKHKKALALYNAKHGTEIKRLRHFHLLEFGSVKMAAQPFLRSAFEATKMTFIRNFGNELRKSIEKFAAKK